MLLERKLFMALVAAGGMLGATNAAAVPITFSFEGVIDEVVTDDFGAFASLSAGTPFSGSYTFESETDSLFGIPGGGFYPALRGYTLEFGSWSFAFAARDPALIIVADGIGGSSGHGDSYVVGSQLQNAYGYGGLQAFIGLEGEDGPGIVGGDLPLTPPELSAFLSAVFGVQDANFHLDIIGTLTSLSFTPPDAVPEPAAVGLLGLGLLGLVAARRRRSKRSG